MPIEVNCRKDEVFDCDTACSMLDSKVPNYEEFMALNLSELHEDCGSLTCEWKVSVPFDHRVKRFMTTGTIDWITAHDYPRLHDILTIKESKWLFSNGYENQYSFNYGLKNSRDSGDLQSAAFFCTGDDLFHGAPSYGPLEYARQNCSGTVTDKLYGQYKFR